MAHTITIKHETEDGYFVADLDNGGLRVGLRDCECFDFPAGHAQYSRAAALTPENTEAAYDDYFERYCC